jgi:hypothetical protein
VRAISFASSGFAFPEKTINLATSFFLVFIIKIWLGREDSNLRCRDQNPVP